MKVTTREMVTESGKRLSVSRIRLRIVGDSPLVMGRHVYRVVPETKSKREGGN